MRSWLLVFGLAGNLAACGPPRPTAPAGAARQLNVPGTRLFIAPPAGFRLATDYTGLQRDDTTGVTVMDLIVGNYYKNAATFSREELEGRGVYVYAYQDTAISGYPAKTLLLQVNPATRGYWAVFGDSTFSVMLTAMYPSRDAEAGAQLKRAILAAKYDKKFQVNPLAIAPFVLDTTQSAFRLALFSGGMYTYTVGGAKAPHQSHQEAAVMVVPIPAEGMGPPAALVAAAEERLEHYGLAGASRRHASAAPVNGYDAYEEEISGTMKGKPALAYELVVSNGHRAVLVQGVMPAGSEGELGSVREFARSIKLK